MGNSNRTTPTEPSFQIQDDTCIHGTLHQMSHSTRQSRNNEDKYDNDEEDEDEDDEMTMTMTMMMMM